jgi:glycosyltransferase involved in cell wall biosynthesis
MGKRLKVVWLCHFSNEEVRKRMPLSKNRLVNLLRFVVGKESNRDYADFSGWITILAREFNKFDAVELHIVSPFHGLMRLNCDFKIDNINYHFFKPSDDFIVSKIFQRIPFINSRRYLMNRSFMKRYVEEIGPDLVNVFGAENPYYSIGALDIKNIPVYLSLQTVYSDPLFEKYVDSYSQERKGLELTIFKSVTYYGCPGLKYRDLVMKSNPEALFFKFMFPVDKPSEFQNEEKKYDFVCFGAVTSEKGIEDVISAFAVVKQQKDNATLHIVGRSSPAYKRVLRALVSDLDLSSNISFLDYFPLQQDLFEHIAKSRIAVLPIKIDLIPSTIREAMILKLPVVTYRTSGTPFLNRHGEAVLLSEIGDISMLAENMLKVLFDSNLRQRLVSNASAVYRKDFDSETIASGLVKDYFAVRNHYFDKVPIPEERMFDENEFPSY